VELDGPGLPQPFLPWRRRRISYFGTTLWNPLFWERRRGPGLIVGFSRIRLQVDLAARQPGQAGRLMAMGI